MSGLQNDFELLEFELSRFYCKLTNDIVSFEQLCPDLAKFLFGLYNMHSTC